MVEKGFSGKQNLQKLLADNGITLQVEEMQNSTSSGSVENKPSEEDLLTKVNVMFPIVDGLETICPGCQKPASIILKTTQYILSEQGVEINFNNTAQYNVQGCPVDQWDDKTFEGAKDDFLNDERTYNGKLLGECLNGNEPKFNLRIGLIHLIRESLDQFGIKAKTSSMSQVKIALLS